MKDGVSVKSKEREFHPIADIFPMMNDAEFSELTESICENGLRDDIWLFENKILDGRNRHQACLKAGVPPKYRQFGGDSMQAVQFVWDENKVRRHLTPSQGAAAVIERDSFVAYHRKMARERMLSGKTDPTQQIEQGDRNQRSTDAQLAKAGGTNRQYVADARKLKKEHPKEFLAVKKGSKTITQAKREIKEDTRRARRQKNADIIQSAQSLEVAIGKAFFSTIVIDPPWDWGDEGDVDQLGRSRPCYSTMTIEEVGNIAVDKYADRDCHLYLWITNRSLPKGFSLIEKWGFRYITCLTWCKPSIGMGNYFRGSTEQALFAVKGSQSLKRKDVGTWFSAPRGKGGHSSKPDEFYNLVESCSPGPYLDIFGREGRKGWSIVGAESPDGATRA